LRFNVAGRQLRSAQHSALALIVTTPKINVDYVALSAPGDGSEERHRKRARAVDQSRRRVERDGFEGDLAERQRLLEGEPRAESVSRRSACAAVAIERHEHGRRERGTVLSG